MHYYLNELGIKDKDIYLQIDEDIIAKHPEMQSETEKYGFASCETWNLDSVACAWLYEHLKMYLDVNCINLDFHKADIPVLVDNPSPDAGSVVNSEWVPYYIEETRTMTQGECIEMCCSYLEDYFKTVNIISIEEEGRGTEKAQCAFKIFAVILPMMWW